MRVCLIAAMAENRVIGKENTLPWNYPEDLQYFKKMTKLHTIIMGRKTYESIGRPLPHRRNIVLSRSNISFQGVELYQSIDDLMKILHAENIDGDVFVIGGAGIYQQFLDLGLVDYIYLTEIKALYEGDTYFPSFEVDFTEIQRKSHEHMDFVIYKKTVHFLDSNKN